MSVAHKRVESHRARVGKRSLSVPLPYLTEKTSGMRELKRICLVVDLKATKLDIQESFLKDQGIKVEVNTLVRKGKVKGIKGTKGKRKDRKLAFIKFPADFQMPEIEV